MSGLMSSGISDQNELGAFLRARRSELSRSDVDLPEGGQQRRVAGLRREEVAQLAAISTDYYTRLEQGRIRASAPVLASLARVLRLDDDQRTYLYEVGGTNASAQSRRRARQKIKPHMQRVLDHITDTPAIVMTPTHDVPAWNPLAAALMVDFGEIRSGNGTSCGCSSPTRACAPSIPTGKDSRVRSSPTSAWRRRASPPIRASPSSSETSPSETSTSASGGPERTLP
jgi:transcriptional regulator with XRE-family HTH domain